MLPKTRTRTDSRFRWNRSHKYNSEYDFPQTKSCTKSTHNIAPPDTLLKLSAGVFHHAHHCLYCFDWRWSKHGSTWVAVSGGRRSEGILTDANLFCIHALMYVNGQPRPWDQRGCVWITSAVWNKPSCYSRCWHRTLQHCQASLYVSSWPSQGWELTSADRRLSPPVREVTAVNAVPEGEDDSHLRRVYMELRLINGASW